MRESLRLLSGAALDLLDPVSAIDGHAELLLGGWRGQLTTSQRDGVCRIHLAATWMTQMCRRLLDLSLIESNELALVLEEVDLPDLIREVVDEHETQARACGQILALRLSSSVATMESDRRWLKAVYSSVLAIAMKHGAPDCSIEVFVQRVTLRSEQETDTREYVCLSITPETTLLSREQATALGSEGDIPARKQPPGAGVLRISKHMSRKLGGDLLVQRRKATQTYYVLTPLTGLPD